MHFSRVNLRTTVLSIFVLAFFGLGSNAVGQAQEPRGEIRVTEQTVELPTGYKNAWSNGMGEYILATNPAFNPNEERRRGTWQRMQLLRNR